MHAETGQAPIDRFTAGGPHRQAPDAVLADAFRWSVTRRVTRVATVPLEGNSYSVDPALTGRRIELRFDPENMARIDVFLDGKPAGAAVPFIIGRHVHKAVAPPQVPPGERTGIDYLGLVAAAHEDEAGAGAKIEFTALAALGGAQPGQEADEPGQDEDEDEGEAR